MDRVVEYQVDTRLGTRNGKAVTAAIVNAESGVSLELFYGDLLPSLEDSIGLTDMTEAWSALQLMPRLRRRREATLRDTALLVRGELHDIRNICRLADDLGMCPDDLVMEAFGYRKEPPSLPEPVAPQAPVPIEAYRALPPTAEPGLLQRLWRWWRRLWTRSPTVADAPGVR